MSPFAIASVVYGAGVVVTGFVVGYIRMSWDSPAPVFATLFWPFSLPMIVGTGAREWIDERANERKALAVEKRKWLEAQLP